jgi:hypothetical protein
MTELTELDVYRKLLKRLTGEDVEIDDNSRSAPCRMSTVSSQNAFGVAETLLGAVMDFIEGFLMDVTEYAMDGDDALDTQARALKRHYLELLGGGE